MVDTLSTESDEASKVEPAGDSTPGVYGKDREERAGGPRPTANRWTLGSFESVVVVVRPSQAKHATDQKTYIAHFRSQTCRCTDTQWKFKTVEIQEIK